MAIAHKSRAAEKASSRKKLIIFLAIGLFLAFGIVLSQTSFDLPFLNPDTNQQLLVFASLSVLIFLLFVALTFVLARNLLKLFAERKLGVLGSKFRTRMVVASLLLSFLPVIVMFGFAYSLMNRSIDRWFSSPLEEVRQDTLKMASILSGYVAQDAFAEAKSIASQPEIRKAFADNKFADVEEEFRERESTLRGGFAIAIVNGAAQTSFNLPAPWPQLKDMLTPNATKSDNAAAQMTWAQTDYTVGSSPVSGNGLILIALPLPKEFSSIARQAAASQQRYLELYRERRLVRRTYMEMLLLLTVVVLFSTTWLALFLSKLVTRPVVALAEATQEISRGRLDYRVEVPAADEIGDLVRSFNRMAEELQSSRHQIDASSHDLEAANVALEQRRRHIETILESIPTGVLSLDADRRITHVNDALIRLFHSSGTSSGAPNILIGSSLTDIFPAEVMQDLESLLRRADRMGTTTTQMDIAVLRGSLNLATTVATLRHGDNRLGHVLVFEDMSDLIKAQKQIAWREVARRVAHEIKNPLTPISLSAERIRRHLQRSTPLDASSLKVIDSCAQTISGAVETVRALVDEFSTLARFPAAKPRIAKINDIVENALSMFNGRLDNIRVHTVLADHLPGVMADAEGIKRAVANLVDNAAEAMQQSVIREIEISTSLVASRDAVEITIADTGHGVTTELKERLFLPYFSTKQRGTGLGLAIVSRIVEDHHGSIRVEENKPIGTRFVIELPIASEGAATNTEIHHA
ncbi:MAG: ATP-binding protein [Acidobacteriota bacterium]|nr:ATP-binding protein [Acidobacteriota bacterium]